MRKYINLDVEISVADVLDELTDEENMQLYKDLKESYVDKEFNFKTIGNLSESELYQIASNLNSNQVENLKRIIKILDK